jgi:hypothetical protein
VSTGSGAGVAGSAVAAVGGVGELDVWQALEVLRRDFEAASVAELTGRGSAGYYARQAGLEMVVAERMRVWAAISMHRALRAGASVVELAQATGLTCEQVTERWRAWADGQRQLDERCPGLGMPVGEYADVVATLVGLPMSTVEQGRRLGSPPTPAGRPENGK